MCNVKSEKKEQQGREEYEEKQEEEEEERNLTKMRTKNNWAIKKS